MWLKMLALSLCGVLVAVSAGARGSDLPTRPAGYTGTGCEGSVRQYIVEGAHAGTSALVAGLDEILQAPGTDLGPKRGMRGRAVAPDAVQVVVTVESENCTDHEIPSQAEAAPGTIWRTNTCSPSDAGFALEEWRFMKQPHGSWTLTRYHYDTIADACPESRGN